MTYLQFHFIFILPAIVVVLIFSLRSSALSRWFWIGLGAHVFMALVYTTPWDNYLVKSGVWSYGSDRVLAVIGYVPIEEYLFFVLQSLLAGLMVAALSFLRKQTENYLQAETQTPARQYQQRFSFSLQAFRWAVVCLMFTTVLCAVYVLVSSAKYEHLIYLGLILSWSLPVLTLHWAYDGLTLIKQWRWVLTSFIVPTLYLCFCDRFAIIHGIWSVSSKKSTGLFILALPIEEALFFLVTNMMITQGLILFLSAGEVFTVGGTASEALLERRP